MAYSQRSQPPTVMSSSAIGAGVNDGNQNDQYNQGSFDNQGHVHTETLPSADVSCLFGCDTNGPNHSVEALPDHCHKLLDIIIRLKEDITLDARRRVELMERILAAQTQVDILKTLLSDLQEVKPSPPPTDLNNVLSEGLNNELTVVVGDMQSLLVAMNNAFNHQPVHNDAIDWSSRVEDLAAAIKAAFDKNIYLVNAIQQDDECMATLQQKADPLEAISAQKDEQLAELERRIYELEVTSYNGDLVWPITQVSLRCENAVNGTELYIQSPPFYTSNTGYKMCVRIYLNGDGMGKGTHISLFFVIMRGQYDAILPWPFKQKVTLMLLDQNNREHVIDAIRPDPSSSSFIRPQSAMNIASGVPLFCPLLRLEDRRYAHVKDDTMFVKVTVDIQGL